MDLPEDRVRDRAGNGNTAATQLSVPVDSTAPTVVSIERHDGTSAKAEHSNADSLTFRVTFSEDVANVNAADFDRERHQRRRHRGRGRHRQRRAGTSSP